MAKQKHDPKKAPITAELVEHPKAGTKTLRGDGAVEVADGKGGTAVIEAPKPKVKVSLRGNSQIDGPVNYVWHRADEMATAAKAAGQPAPKRKDVVNTCVAEGVAPYTARTQYQLWYKHTDAGRRLMSEGNPRVEKRKPVPVDPAAETEELDEE